MSKELEAFKQLEMYFREDISIENIDKVLMVIENALLKYEKLTKSVKEYFKTISEG